VLPNREHLDVVAEPGLAGRTVDVRWQQADSRRYQLVEIIGRGQTGVAWRVLDALGRDFALKFVLRADYGTHSLDAEARRANSLQSRLFARIDFFGEPSFESDPLALGEFYAISVEWVDGPSLHDFLANPNLVITPEVFLRLTRDLCEILQALKDRELCHSDLHERNILVRKKPDALAQSDTVEITVIDSGQLKTQERRFELLELWRQQLDTIQDLGVELHDQVERGEQRLRRLVDYFSRTDQEWVVYHLCCLYNRMRGSLTSFNAGERRFLRHLPESLREMVDPDVSRRIDDPRQMHNEITRLWVQSTQPQQPGMISPFDLPSAELIRSDRQLMALFSEEYPRLDACRSIGPIYLYGPRGCGKSTILRSLSLKAVLASENPADEFAKCPIVGVYLSASQELRSRFWLMRPEDIDLLEAHVVRYFNLLLLESLAETLHVAFQADQAGPMALRFFPSEDIAIACDQAIRHRVGLDASSGRYAGVSHFSVLRNELRQARDALWLEILDRQTARQRTDAQLVFDVCRDLEGCWPFLKEHRLVFLVDDYSNQRIPVALQKRLNQAITFSKQGSPIFKVTSEYDGVDLEGVQEGREVHEVNVGFEYVSLESSNRYRFLKSLLDHRFTHLEHPTDLLQVLPPSDVGPSIDMARQIRAAHQSNKRFYYHGLDTISDLCSGDFAMAIDLVRRMFEHARVDWRAPTLISPAIQDKIIREYAKHEFEYIRYQSRDGKAKYTIADRLCWLSGQCILTKDTKKNDVVVPVVKNHLDITETALRELETQPQYSQLATMLRDLVTRGVLFPLQSSRARQGRDATYRLMLRRILLAIHTTALGRDQPIRIDDVQRLVYLLTEPAKFVDDELERTSSRSAMAEQSKPTHTQRELDLGLEESSDA
jgi:Cdc6-like AAA superfamily ATPase/tRNA A-37 threonylcarbamoyl transferase component Bud32